MDANKRDIAMDDIPQDLIHTLTKLGLVESEARIYVALLMMKNAEVRELIAALGFSKPSTYASLRTLEDKGLIVLVNAKPMIYQAVPEDVGLEILVDAYVKAKEEAKDRLSVLNKSGMTFPGTARSPDSLWFVFNKKNIEYKIRDMLRNAKKSVFLIASDRYVKHFTQLANTSLDLELIVFSENPRMEKSLKKIFKSNQATIQVVSTVELVNALSKLDSVYQEGLLQPLEETLLMLNFGNTLFLIVDDAEILSVPPLSNDNTIGFNLRDARAIANRKLKYKDLHPR
jgi:sugar-specific transcriptional regulator TrmB